MKYKYRKRGDKQLSKKVENIGNTYTSSENKKKQQKSIKDNLKKN